MYKKAVSAIVATVLVLLLTFVLIGIVWVVIKGALRGPETQIQIQQACAQTDLEITKAVWNTTNNNNISITIKRGTGGGEIVGLTAVIYKGTDTSVAVPIENPQIDELTTKTFVINVTKYDSTFTTKPSKVELAARVKVGDAEGDCTGVLATITEIGEVS